MAAVVDGDDGDGSGSNVIPDAAIDSAPLGPWGTPTAIVLAQPTNTDDDPSLTGDELELVMNSSRGGNADIYEAVRATTADAWSIPTQIAALSSPSSETTPEISYDGLSIQLASDRPGGDGGGQDLWFSTRATRTSGWAIPQTITGVNSSASEAAGNITPDGLTFVFSSTKLNGGPDLFIVERATPSAPWGTPVEITAVNLIGHEGSPFISADKLTLYFDTDRNGNLDVYMSQRASTTDAFPAPVEVTEIATSFGEEDPWVSQDGRRLLFTSNRSGTYQLWESVR